MSDADYRLEVKRSARRTNGAAGEWVNREGARRRFETKALARQWAREISQPGGRVWVQDAAPHDPAPVDGYLVGGRRPGGDSERGGRQASLSGE